MDLKNSTNSSKIVTKTRQNFPLLVTMIIRIKKTQLPKVDVLFVSKNKIQ